MKLKFLGRGSAFCNQLGNTSAYYVEENRIIIVDMGELSCCEIEKRHLIEGMEEVYLCITHTHSDHIGSLGTFLNLFHFKYKVPVYLCCASTIQDDISTLATIFGVGESWYSFVSEKEICKVFRAINDITFCLVEHVPELPFCYSILFDTTEGLILYSGDSHDTKWIMTYLNHSRLSRMYVDVTDNLPVAHLDIELLEKIVPKELRGNIYCMHFPNATCIQKAVALGFSIVK